MTEEDLRNHFKAFGRVVELQIIGTEGSGEKKAYNECLVQMGTAQDAKKCLNSPSAVLNNRFVKVMYSTFNIVDLADVQPLAVEYVHAKSVVSSSLSSSSIDHYNNGGITGSYSNDGATSAISSSSSGSIVKEMELPSVINAVRKTKKWVNEDIPAGSQWSAKIDQLYSKPDIEEAKEKEKERRLSGVGVGGRGYGVSNKFIASHISGIPEPIRPAVSTSAAIHNHDASVQSGVGDDGIDEGTGMGDMEGDPLYSGLDLDYNEVDNDDTSNVPKGTSFNLSAGGGMTAITVPAIVTAPISVPLTEEDRALQVQYEGLRALRLQADNISKKKESLLQVLPLYKIRFN